MVNSRVKVNAGVMVRGLEYLLLTNILKVKVVLLFKLIYLNRSYYKCFNNSLLVIRSKVYGGG